MVWEPPVLKSLCGFMSAEAAALRLHGRKAALQRVCQAYGNSEDWLCIIYRGNLGIMEKKMETTGIIEVI